MILKINKIKGSNNNLCLFPKSVFNSLNLIEKSLYTLHLGQLKASVFVGYHSENNNNLYLTHETFQKLLLYSNITLNLWTEDENIYLGPVVGVFVNTGFLKSIAKNKPPLSAVKHLQANDEGNCFLYYFSIENINWLEKKIKGYVFSPAFNEWKEYWLPLPNVIYDRGVGFNSKEKLLVKHIRQQFHFHPNIHFINNKDYLGKWQLYRKLSPINEVAEYLPVTTKYTCFKDLETMLSKYSFVFLKSYYGSRGREVFSIRQVAEGFQVNYFEGKLLDIYVDNLSALNKIVEDFIEDRPFIMQQGIHLYKHNGRSMDMRVLLEKDGFGRWQAIYNQVRIAPENLSITNCSAGGSIDNYENIFLLSLLDNNFLLPSDIKIREEAIKIATFIEKVFGTFGELGMDLAVDENGKVWFIEANTKPDKNPEIGLEDTEGISPQCLCILQYGKYLVKGVTKNV